MWKILGIEPTNDMNLIKSAYTRLVLKYDPEAYPEEFRIISEAYKSACRYAMRNSRVPHVRRISPDSKFAREYAGFNNITVMVNETKIKTQLAKIASQKALAEYYDASYGGLHDISDSIKKMTNRIKNILRDKLEKNDISSWRRILSTHEFDHVISEDKFRKNSARLLKNTPLRPEIADYIARRYKFGSRTVPYKNTPFRSVYISYSGSKAPIFDENGQVRNTGKTVLKRIFAFVLAVLLVIQLLIMLGFLR